MKDEEAKEIGELTGLRPQLVQYLVELLATVYGEADWKKITGRRRRALDVFEHKVKASSSQPTIPQFTEKLCHSLGLQSIEVSPDIITALDKDRGAVLKSLRRESIYWVLLCSKEAK